MTGVTDKASQLGSQQLEETMKMFFGSMKKGASPKEILDIQPETIEYFYSQAYRLYNQGKYQEALYLFQMLTMMDPGVPRHALGSAACLHRMGKYEAAGQVYLIAGPLDAENPLPFFHAADCYIKLKVYEIAEFSLQKCLELCGDKQQFALVKERASVMLEACQAEIAIENKKVEEALKKQAEEGKSTEGNGSSQGTDSE